MKPAPFIYIRAESPGHAAALLAEHGPGATLIAGGQSLLASMNMRRSSPDLLVDIGRLQELQGISLDGGHLRVGGATRHVDLETSDLIARHAPLFAAAVKHVAHAAVRNRGTVGGNLALADPASELPACCVASDVQIELLGPGGTRTLPAGRFFVDAFVTARRDDELLTAIRIPLAGASTRVAFREFARRRGALASAGLAMQSELEGGRVLTVSPVFFALKKTPQLASQTAAPLSGSELGESEISDAVRALADEIQPIGDMHASAAFKLHLAQQFFREALQELHDAD